MLFVGFGGRKEGGEGDMRRSCSLDMLAPPVHSGMGPRNSSYNMLSNIASLMMSVSVPGHELPFAIQAQHNRQVDGYVGEQGTKPGQLEFYMKRKNPPAPGEGGGREGERMKGEGRDGKAGKCLLV